MSLNAQSNGAVGLPICNFLLVCNSNYMNISHCLEVITAGRNYPVYYHYAKISTSPTAVTHVMEGK